MELFPWEELFLFQADTQNGNGVMAMIFEI